MKVYCSLVRSILEYASPVWHCGLTQKLSDDIEAVQRRCLKIIFPLLSYGDALQVACVETLSSRREKAVAALFARLRIKITYCITFCLIEYERQDLLCVTHTRVLILLQKLLES